MMHFASDCDAPNASKLGHKIQKQNAICWQDWICLISETEHARQWLATKTLLVIQLSESNLVPFCQFFLVQFFS